MRGTWDPPAGDVGDPFQIRSSPFFPRRDFIDCSPRTQRIDSAIFDFPDPFGPTIAVTLEGNSKTVDFANDLKPDNPILVRFITIPFGYRSRLKIMDKMFLRQNGRMPQIFRGY